MKINDVIFQNDITIKEKTIVLNKNGLFFKEIPLKSIVNLKNQKPIPSQYGQIILTVKDITNKQWDIPINYSNYNLATNFLKKINKRIS